MPIPAQEIADEMRSALDAEGADYYRDDLDIIPAINNAVRWTESVINKTLGQKKPGEEAFRDLIIANVFRTSSESRISLNNFPNEVWTIISVEPLPITGSNGAPVPPTPLDIQSYYRPDLYHKKSTKSSKRLTAEEWTIGVNENPFSPGYDGGAICDNLKEYAYLNPVTYNPDNSVSIASEIEISPALNKELVTVFYAKRPTPVTQLSDNIPFPRTVFQLILARALQFISYKQGDGTSLWAVSQSDVNALLQMIN